MHDILLGRFSPRYVFQFLFGILILIDVFGNENLFEKTGSGDELKRLGRDLGEPLDLSSSSRKSMPGISPKRPRARRQSGFTCSDAPKWRKIGRA
jgi:hypothetical protein